MHLWHQPMRQDQTASREASQTCVMPLLSLRLMKWSLMLQALINLSGPLQSPNHIAEASALTWIILTVFSQKTNKAIVEKFSEEPGHKAMKYASLAQRWSF